MNDLELRLKRLEERDALEDVLLSYYAAVDGKDIDGILACFIEDGEFDVTGLDLPMSNGHAEIAQFFADVFANTAHHSHHVSNFRVKAVEGDRATGRGYVIGKAIGSSGSELLVFCSYDIDYVRTTGGWKMRRFEERALIPFGAQIAALHGSDDSRSIAAE